MTLRQTAVVVAGEVGVLSVDTQELKPILTEVRVVKMVNEAPHNDSEHRSQSATRATKMSVGLCERGTRNITVWSYLKCRLPRRVRNLC
jgi:hypothetical protein